MTRDEAIAKIANGSATTEIPCNAANLVEILSSLGMLKLDEPKGLPQKLRDFVSDTRLVQGGAMERLGALQHVLADCGLKIVEE